MSIRVNHSLWTIAAIVGLALVLAALPGRTAIVPNVESDYCYQLMAADRLVAGEGLTALPPLAPGQPWAWRGDWTFLTQWPAGYPVLIAIVRWLTGLGTVAATQWMAVVACALALVGWFTWLRRCLPRTWLGVALAVVGAMTAVSVASLVDPTTDTILVAMTPWVLLAFERAVRDTAHDGGLCEPTLQGLGMPPAQQADIARRPWWALRAHPTIALFAAGLLAGSACWVRYAAVFLPGALGVYLLLAWRRTRRVSARSVAAYALGAALPMVGLFLLNHFAAAGTSTQAQFNLGHQAGLDFSPRLAAEAWWTYADLPYYGYLSFAHAALAAWPAVLLAGAALSAAWLPAARRRLASYFAEPAVAISGVTLLSLLVLLVTVTAVFGDKYHYTTLERYYLPARPLYFVLFAGPLLLVPSRLVKLGLAAALWVAGSWTLRYEWPRPYQRWLAADRPVTPYGRWAVAFDPGASELISWLELQAGPDLVVISNFQDHLALETGIPAIPIPPDDATLRDWLTRIAAERGTPVDRVLFVLDPDNRHRSYFLPKPADVVSRFALRRPAAVPPAVSAWVYEYAPPAAAATIAHSR